MKKITMDEWLAEGKRLYGENMLNWRFVCPSCGNIQTAEDFRPYKDRGATPDSARFNCIGRYDGHIDVPIGSKPGPCNYTTGGLFNISPVKVIGNDGKEYSSFEFADNAQSDQGNPKKEIT